MGRPDEAQEVERSFLEKRFQLRHNSKVEGGLLRGLLVFFDLFSRFREGLIQPQYDIERIDGL